MSESKCDRLHEYIRRCVHQGMSEWSKSNGNRDFIATNLDAFEVYVSSVITEKYRMLELCDIIEWKNRPHP